MMNEVAWFCLVVITVVVTFGTVRIFEIIYNHKDGDSEDED